MLAFEQVVRQTPPQTPQLCASLVRSRQVPEQQACPGEQALLHIPQLAVSLLVFLHTPEQATRPAGHAQAPFEHPIPVGHACPHVPQFWLSPSLRLRQFPLQRAHEGGQPQVPLVQIMSAPRQALPHILQFCASLLRSLQLPEQAVWPVGQTQALLTQTFPPEQELPQAPQLCTSFAKFEHVPPQF